MPADPVLARELQSLQKELSGSRRARSTDTNPASSHPASGAAVPAGTTQPPGGPPVLGEDEQQVREQLGQLADEITGFFDRAERDISTHPIESVAVALLVGILIGRLLGRR